MYIRALITLLFVGFMLSGCDSKKAPSSSEKKETTTKKVVTSDNKLPPLPNNRMKRLWDEATQLDYIFLNLPISMNMDNQEAIRSSMSYFLPDGVTLNPNCKQHEGSMLFSIDGELVEECQFFYEDGCRYFVWLENGKKTYANQMSPTGVEFMEKLFTGAILNQSK